MHVFLISFFLMIMMTGHISARTVYVDRKIGTASCETYNPVQRDCIGLNLMCFGNIQSALKSSDYGDTILIREGFYPGQLIVNLTSNKAGYLTIMSFNGEEVRIDGNNPNIGPLIKIESDRVRIRNLKVSHSSTFGIYSIKTNDILIDNCEVSYSNDGGIVFVDAGNIVVSNCHVHHNNYEGLRASHEGVTMHNVNTFEVHHCLVHDNKEEGIDAKYGSKLGKIHHNTVYRNNGPNVYIDKTNQIDVYNNIIHSAVSKAGISLNIESAYHREGLSWTLEQVNIYNNLIYNNHGGIGFWIEPGDGKERQARWDNISIVNNTIVNNAYDGETRGGGIYILNPKAETFGDNIIVRNNIFSGNINKDSRSIRDDSGEHITDKFRIDHNLFIEGEKSDASGEKPVISKSAGFVNAKDSDFSLEAFSPAINSGSREGVPEMDFDGKKRIHGCDIGAFEYVK